MENQVALGIDIGGTKMDICKIEEKESYISCVFRKRVQTPKETNLLFSPWTTYGRSEKLIKISGYKILKH